MNKLKQSLIRNKFTKDIEFSMNQDEKTESSNYLILKLGNVYYSEVLILKKRLNLIRNNFSGMIVLS